MELCPSGRVPVPTFGTRYEAIGFGFDEVRGEVMEQNQRVRDWLRRQLQEYELSPQQLSELLGGALSISTIDALLKGSLLWTTVPNDDKDEIIPKLTEILGPLPTEEPSPAVFRSSALAEPPPVITDEIISGWLGEADSEGLDSPSNDARPPDIEPTQGSFFSDDPHLALEETEPDDQDNLGDNPTETFPQPYLEGLFLSEFCNRCQRPVIDDTERCPNCHKPLDHSH